MVSVRRLWSLSGIIVPESYYVNAGEAASKVAPKTGSEE